MGTRPFTRRQIRRHRPAEVRRAEHVEREARMLERKIRLSCDDDNGKWRARLEALRG